MWWRVMGATDKEGGVSCGGGQAVMGVGSWGVIGVSGKEGDAPLVEVMWGSGGHRSVREGGRRAFGERPSRVIGDGGRSTR